MALANDGPSLLLIEGMLEHIDAGDRLELALEPSGREAAVDARRKPAGERVYGVGGDVEAVAKGVIEPRHELRDRIAHARDDPAPATGVLDEQSAEQLLTERAQGGTRLQQVSIAKHELLAKAQIEEMDREDVEPIARAQRLLIAHRADFAHGIDEERLLRSHLRARGARQESQMTPMLAERTWLRRKLGWGLCDRAHARTDLTRRGDRRAIKGAASRLVVVVARLGSAGRSRWTCEVALHSP